MDTKKKITLNRTMDRLSMNLMLDEVLDSDKNPLCKELEIDFCYINFIQPAGIVALHNMIEWLIKKDVKVSFTYKTKNNGSQDPLKYLDDSDFFNRHLGESIYPNASVRATTMPLQDVKYGESHGWLKYNFIPWLAQQLNVKISTLANIEMCLGEIFNNINDHSMEQIGCIYAQFYPNKNLLTFCIADFGVGIPYNIRKFDKNLSDEKALQLAIKEGFTTKTTPRNLGAGLYTLIRNVVLNLRGSVHINSGYGLLDVFSNQGKMVIRSKETTGYYPGTFLEFNIDTNIVKREDIENDDEEDFSW